MAINYSSPGVPGGEVSPGAGSTGFTSAGVAFANSSGQLTASTGLQWADHATSGKLTISSTQSAFAGAATGSLVVGPSNAPSIGIGGGRVQSRTSAGAATDLILQGSGGVLQVGSSNSTTLISVPSTVMRTSAVGAAGAAAALPATPESYLKVLAPNNAGTLTTLYVPLYLSTA